MAVRFAGSEWPEYIAEHLESCSCLLAFISSAFVGSNNCKSELSYALELRKDLLVVYIEDAELSPGMRMRLHALQFIDRRNFESDGAFIESLAKARVLSGCKSAIQSGMPSIADGQGSKSASPKAQLLAQQRKKEEEILRQKESQWRREIEDTLRREEHRVTQLQRELESAGFRKAGVERQRCESETEQRRRELEETLRRYQKRVE